MKTAIITGASSGIGLATTKVLLELGFKVYGIGRDFSKVEFNHTHFIKLEQDLLNVHETAQCIQKIRKVETVELLINNAGIGYFGLHEEMNEKKLHEMITINLEIPLLLTQLLLRDLKKVKGTIINISSIEAKKASTHGCAYGATKAALSHFSNSLFEESRKYGVKVIALHPDITKTNFYRNADFEQGQDEASYLVAEEIAEAVKMILLQREGIVISDLTIRPQKHQLSKK